MGWFGASAFWVFRKLFGTPTGGYWDSLRWPLRTIEGIAYDDARQFSSILTALPQALPARATLRIKPSSRREYVDFRKLCGREDFFPGGLFGKGRSVFWLHASAENVARICEFHDYESGWAMNIEAFAGSECVMDWCVMFDHQPWFSAAVDAQALRQLAIRSGGVLSAAFTLEQLKEYEEFRKWERVHWD